MASGRILVINPNSNPEVTAGLRDAVQSFTQLRGPEIACIELPGVRSASRARRMSGR